MASSLTPISAISSNNQTCPSFNRKLKTTAMAKELYFNHGGSATKKFLAGVDLVAELVGVTLGPKGRNVVLQNKYGPPKIVHDGETILKEIELEDPLENVGVKLVRQAGAKTNDIAGDGSTTSIVLAQGLISEGVKVIAAGMNPIQISQGIEKTTDVQREDDSGVPRLQGRAVNSLSSIAFAALSCRKYSQGALVAVSSSRLKNHKSHYLDDIAILTGGS
ncbi:hypothetical protein LOK49_Contig138G00006 [Camellia lanceoleosa]|nr:hypothetical protein LOK49_Contig138G00006 [Camellia lanceoleosa]